MATSAERMRRLRERQRGGLEAVPGATPEHPALLASVDTTVAALGLAAGDSAAAELARAYARAIDQAADHGYTLVRLGPKLLRCLMALGATPATRKPVEPPRRPSQLDRMRQAHARGRPYP